MELKRFFNLSINVESNEKGGSIIRLNSNHLVINDWIVPCQMGLVEWDSKVPIRMWEELMKEEVLPEYPFDDEVDLEHLPYAALGDELMYMEGFEFNPYHVLDNITNSHHSIWNVKRNGNIVASIEAGVMPVDGEDVVYVRRGEFLGVLTNHGNTMRGYETSGNPIRYLQTLHESGELI